MASVKETLRRLYHDLVLRRSRVRVVAPSPARLDTPPIFIVGLYGSGTTVLRYVLDSHSRIACGPESDFIAGLARLAEDPLYIQGLDSLGVDENHLAIKLRQFCAEIFSTYAASWKKSRWADKTPAYVDHLPWIDRLFPEARYLFLHRHGLDQAHSFTRGGTFPRPALEGFGSALEDLRLRATRYWCAKTRQIIRFEAEVAERGHRLRYEDLGEHPEEVLQQVFQFLDEPWEEDVLEYWKRPHDKGHEHGRVLATRRIEARVGHYLGWNQELREACLDLAAPELEVLGYRPVAA